MTVHFGQITSKLDRTCGDYTEIFDYKEIGLG